MDQFADHARLLKGERVDLNADEPISGWFRCRKFKGGPFLPVRVFRDGDFEMLTIVLNGKPATAEEIGWPYTGKHAVPQAHYDHYMATGRWPDVDGTVHDQIGDNRPPTDPAELLAEMIKSASAGADAYAKIENDETAAKAQTLRSRLIELSGQADKMRVAEKEPHLEAGRAVDARWQPIVKMAKSAADAIRTAMGAWETAKWQKQQVPQAAEQMPLAPYVPPAAPSKIKGGVGRAASVSTITQVQSVSDWSALAAFMCLQSDVQAVLLKTANTMLKADAAAKIPGVVIQQIRNVV